MFLSLSVCLYATRVSYHRIDVDALLSTAHPQQHCLQLRPVQRSAAVRVGLLPQLLRQELSVSDECQMTGRTHRLTLDSSRRRVAGVRLLAATYPRFVLPTKRRAARDTTLPSPRIFTPHLRSVCLCLASWLPVCLQLVCAKTAPHRSTGREHAATRRHLGEVAFAERPAHSGQLSLSLSVSLAPQRAGHIGRRCARWNSPSRGRPGLRTPLAGGATVANLKRAGGRFAGVLSVVQGVCLSPPVRRRCVVAPVAVSSRSSFPVRQIQQTSPTVLTVYLFCTSVS